MKKLLGGLALAAAVAAATAGLTDRAQAKVDIDVFIGPGIYVPVPGRLACRDAAFRIWERGYRSIRARDCRGTVYEYQARRFYRLYIFRVSAFDGRILSRHRIY
jgi:hypothetical protein